MSEIDDCDPLLDGIVNVVEKRNDQQDNPRDIHEKLLQISPKVILLLLRRIDAFTRPKEGNRHQHDKDSREDVNRNRVGVEIFLQHDQKTLHGHAAGERTYHLITAD